MDDGEIEDKLLLYLNDMIEGLELNHPPYKHVDDIEIPTLVEINCRLNGLNFNDYIPSMDRPWEDVQGIIFTLQERFGKDKFQHLSARRIAALKPLHLACLMQILHTVFEHERKKGKRFAALGANTQETTFLDASTRMSGAAEDSDLTDTDSGSTIEELKFNFILEDSEGDDTDTHEMSEDSAINSGGDKDLYYSFDSSFDSDYSRQSKAKASTKTKEPHGNDRRHKGNGSKSDDKTPEYSEMHAAQDRADARSFPHSSTPKRKEKEQHQARPVPFGGISGLKSNSSREKSETNEISVGKPKTSTEQQEGSIPFGGIRGFSSLEKSGVKKTSVDRPKTSTEQQEGSIPFGGISGFSSLEKSGVKKTSVDKPKTSTEQQEGSIPFGGISGVSSLENSGVKKTSVDKPKTSKEQQERSTPFGGRISGLKSTSSREEVGRKVIPTDNPSTSKVMADGASFQKETEVAGEQSECENEKENLEDRDGLASLDPTPESTSIEEFATHAISQLGKIRNEIEERVRKQMGEALHRVNKKNRASLLGPTGTSSGDKKEEAAAVTRTKGKLKSQPVECGHHKIDKKIQLLGPVNGFAGVGPIKHDHMGRPYRERFPYYPYGLIKAQCHSSSKRKLPPPDRHAHVFGHGTPTKPAALSHKEREKKMEEMQNHMLELQKVYNDELETLKLEFAKLVVKGGPKSFDKIRGAWTESYHRLRKEAAKVVDKIVNVVENMYLV